MSYAVRSAFFLATVALVDKQRSGRTIVAATVATADARKRLQQRKAGCSSQTFGVCVSAICRC